MTHFLFPNLVQWLWNNLLHVTAMYGSKMLLLHALLSVAGIFVVGVVIDQFRILLFEKPYLRWGEGWKWRPVIFYLEKENEKE